MDLTIGGWGPLSAQSSCRPPCPCRRPEYEFENGGVIAGWTNLVAGITLMRKLSSILLDVGIVVHISFRLYRSMTYNISSNYRLRGVILIRAASNHVLIQTKSILDQAVL
jgi:hypothetical protein